MAPPEALPPALDAPPAPPLAAPVPKEPAAPPTPAVPAAPSRPPSAPAPPTLPPPRRFASGSAGRCSARSRKNDALIYKPKKLRIIAA